MTGTVGLKFRIKTFSAGDEIGNCLERPRCGLERPFPLGSAELSLKLRLETSRRLRCAPNAP